MPAATDTKKLVRIVNPSTSFLLPVSEGSIKIIPKFDRNRKDGMESKNMFSNPPKYGLQNRVPVLQ